MDWNETIPALISALNNHSKALNGFVAATGKAGAGGGAAAATEKPKPAGDKPKPDKAKAISDDDMRTNVGDYIAAADDEDDREVRRSNVKAMLAHYEAKGATGIPAAKRAEALGYIKQFAAGERPDFMPEEDAPSDDLLG